MKTTKTICVLVKLILQSPTLPLTQQLTPLQPLWRKQAMEQLRQGEISPEMHGYFVPKVQNEGIS